MQVYLLHYQLFNCVAGHHVHIMYIRTHQLMTEIFKSLDNTNPSIQLEFHEKKCAKYDLRKENPCKLPKTKTVSYGVESLSSRGSGLWNALDESMKYENQRLSALKTK